MIPLEHILLDELELLISRRAHIMLEWGIEPVFLRNWREISASLSQDINLLIS